jgi:hypothetical protein
MLLIKPAFQPVFRLDAIKRKQARKVVHSGPRVRITAFFDVCQTGLASHESRLSKAVRS